MSMSDEDDFEIVPKRAFDIGEMPDVIDMSTPPANGIEYLRRVRYEQLRCPEVMIAKIDPKKYSHKQTVKVDTCNGSVPAPPGFAPSAEWQSQQVKAFSSLRMRLIKERNKFKGKKKIIPNIENVKAWCAFCLGEEFAKICESASSETDDVETKKVPSRQCNGQAPLISTLVQLIQPEIETLISYHINWLKQFNFSHHQGCWLYVLLIFLEKPLTPNACDLLRTLARTCASLRSKLESKEDEFLTPLNLFICLVANYFDQKDMSDE